MDLISELKRKQQKEPLIYESDRDGAIEDIITGGGLAGAVLSWAFATLSSIHPPTLASVQLSARGLPGGGEDSQGNRKASKAGLFPSGLSAAPSPGLHFSRTCVCP